TSNSFFKRNATGIHLHQRSFWGALGRKKQPFTKDITACQSQGRKHRLKSSEDKACTASDFQQALRTRKIECQRRGEQSVTRSKPEVFFFNFCQLAIRLSLEFHFVSRNFWGKGKEI